MQLRVPPERVLPTLIKSTAFFLIGEVIWFGLLYPLVPTSPVAWIVTLLLPIPIAAYAFFAVRTIYWIAPQPPARIWRQALAVLLAVSVGVFIFVAVYLAQHQLLGQFHYGYLRRR
jgi:hypothetical protein